MNMISDAIAVVRECVEGLGQNEPIFNVRTLAANKWRVFTRPLWLTVGSIVTSNSAEYEVVEVGCDYIDVQGENAPQTSISTPAIYFKHGTIVSVNTEMIGISNAKKFTPLVYYVEATSIQLNFDTEVQVDAVNDARLFVLMSCNVKDWLTDEHYSNVLIPCEKITKELILKFEQSDKIGDLENEGQGRAANYINVGSYEDKGAKKNLFVFPMSGVELRISLPLRRQYCEC